MCNHELKRLYYTSDDDYDILSCRVELENVEGKYTLCYCEKCGQVFIMEIAEKRRIIREIYTYPPQEGEKQNE